MKRERLAWLLLLSVALVTRFWDLGARAMSHDESLHAYYSHQLFSTGHFEHTPSLHGPFLFHLTAAIFWLAGVDDTTARIYPALAGMLLVPVLFLYRRWLGRTGALCAAALVVISPTFLFYGRYLRNDVFVCVVALLWLHCALSYLVEPRQRWLWGVVAAMALGFAAKEVTFIFGATIGVFFAALAFWRTRLGREPARRSPAADLAILQLLLVLPFLSAFAYLLLGWDAADWTGDGALGRSCLVAGGLAFAALVAGWVWFARRRRWWLGAFTAFWAFEACLFTTLFTNARGIPSGVVGSLGYWFGQHPVARGGQPLHYYGVLALVYEFLPWALATAAALWLLRRLPDRGWQPVAPIEGESTLERQAREGFFFFCLWWSAASWVAYSLAGERMPWLFTHIALPMTLLAGWFLSRLIESARRQATPRRSALALLALGPLICISLLHLVAPGGGSDEIDVARALGRRAGEALLCAALLALIVREWRRIGRTAALRWLALGGVTAAGLLTLRAGLHLTFRNGDLATEPLVYAHGTPDIKRALAEIEELSLRIAGDRSLVIARDDETSWPFAWYLRDFRNVRYFADQPTAEALDAPVVLLGDKNRRKAWPYLVRGFVERRYRQVWWPLEGYKDLSWSRLRAFAADPAARSALWQILMHRRYPGTDLARWPMRKEFSFYLRHDVAGAAWHLPPSPPAFLGGPVPALELTVRAAIEGSFDGAKLTSPTAVAFAPGGRLLLADSGNHRILSFRGDGLYEDSVGSKGEGPGEFKEPWGLAVWNDGSFAVADTWNGRVQRFGSDGRFESLVGSASGLYGPRSLLFLPSGELLIADTGNKRLLAARAGEPAEPLTTATALDEPVGLAPGADGRVLIADTWNRRIVAIDRAGRSSGEFPVPLWVGAGTYDKPYLATDDLGRIWATDPDGGRIVLFDSTGTMLGYWSLPDGDSSARPVGIAFDSASRALAVADHSRNFVYLLDLPENEGTEGRD